MDIFDELESLLIERYGDWDGKEQFRGTSKRLRKILNEMYWPSDKIEREIKKAFKATFTERYDQLLVEGPISVWTLCPHHLLPCNFEIQIGYIPSDGMVLGISKFSRVATILGKRPVMQEQYSRELADLLQENLNPKGLGVYVRGSHGCMISRGVMQQKTIVSTSIVKGALDKEASTREEFFNMVRRNGWQS